MYDIFGILAALCRASTGFCNNDVCAGHICYLGHIIGYRVLAGSQLHLRYVKLWEIILISIRKPLFSRKAWFWRVLTWSDEFTRLPALPSAGVGLSLSPTHGHGLCLCSCLCPGLNSFFSYSQQEPEAHGRDLVTRWSRMLEKLKTKFFAPQRLTGFAYLSLFWPFLEPRALCKNETSSAHQIQRT